jgi:hypothetical protein
MAAPTKPKIAAKIGTKMIEPTPMAIPPATLRLMMLKIVWMSPLTAPIMTMNISGSTNPPVFGIPLKNEDGDVKTLMAVF